MNRPFRYVALEGIDGAGKDTQLTLLARSLDLAGITPVTLHEPSYGEHGRRIRAGLHNLTTDQSVQRAMFTADRLDHVEKKIGPLLQFVDEHPQFAVLQNRSLLSAAAYQPRSGGDAGLIETVNAELASAPMPEAIVILDLSVAEALERMDRAGERDSLERRNVLDGCAVRYRRLATLVPKCHLVDASGSAAEVGARVHDVLGMAFLA